MSRFVVLLSIVLFSSSAAAGLVALSQPGGTELAPQGASPPTLAPTAPTDGDEAFAATLRFEACAHRIGVFPVDAAQVAAFLPEGFRPLPFLATGPGAGSGLPGTPGTSATVQLLAQSCIPAAGQGLPAERIDLMQAWIYVDAPARYRSDGIEAYLVVTKTFVSSEATANALTALGLPAVAGTLSFSFDIDTASASSGEARASAGGAEVLLSTSVPHLVRDSVPEHLRLIGVTDRQVTGVTDFIEETHTHLLIGMARIASTGSPGFPVPPGPGVAIHVEAGYAMTWQRIEAE